MVGSELELEFGVGGGKSDSEYVAELGGADNKIGWWIVLRVAGHQKRIVCACCQGRAEEYLVIRVREMGVKLGRFHQLAMRNDVIYEVMDFIFRESKF